MPGSQEAQGQYHVAGMEISKPFAAGHANVRSFAEPDPHLGQTECYRFLGIDIHPRSVVD